MSQAQLLPTSEPTPTFPAISYKGTPVLTTEMLARAYGVNAKQIRQNFSNNRARFTEGKHFYMLYGNELKEFKDCVEIIDSVAIPTRTKNLTLWTDRGSARHAKMLESDTAWDVYELLEDTFFNVKPKSLPSTLTPSTPDTRRPLEKLVKVWASQAHMPHAQAWTQVNAHFTLNGIADLPTEWIPDAIAFVEAKIEGLQKVLPEMDKAKHLVPRKSAGKTCTEDALHRLLLETNSLDSTRYKFDDWFKKLSLITGPMYLRAIEAMRTTDNDVLTDNLIGTLHSQAWYAKEKIRDASQAARDACRTAMVVARMMGE